MDLEFTPETLRNFTIDIEKLRHEMLFDMKSAGADPFAEQHFLAALAHLELAQRALTLAQFSQSRALAGN
jgi:hypothetical protein